MIYRFYKIVEPYISETIQKSIHDHNVKNPQHFIFDNHYEKIIHVRVKKFDNAEQVLDFEKSDGFISWLYPLYPIIESKIITNTLKEVYVLRTDLHDQDEHGNKYPFDEKTQYYFNDYIQKFPEEQIISYQD